MAPGMSDALLSHVLMFTAAMSVSFGNTAISLLGLRGYGSWTLLVYRGFVCPLITVPMCLLLGYSVWGRTDGLGRRDLIAYQAVFNASAIWLGLFALDVRVHLSLVSLSSVSRRARADPRPRAESCGVPAVRDGRAAVRPWEKMREDTPRGGGGAERGVGAARAR